MLLVYGYMRNNLVCLADIPLTEILLICQISFIFILCLYDQEDDALTEISPFEVKWDQQKLI